MSQLKIPFNPAKFRKPEITREQAPKPEELTVFEEQHSFFFIDVVEAFVPNSLSSPAPNEQFICRIKLIDEHFALANKALATYNSTLQYENETSPDAVSTRYSEQIQPNCTHAEPFYANGNFISKSGIYAESKQFPIGNSAYCNFNSERLYFLDTQDNISQYFLYCEIEQIPTWHNPKSVPLVYAVMRVKDFLQFENEECDIELFKYAGEEEVIAKMSEMRPLEEIEYINETEFANLFKYKTSKKDAGQLRVKIGFETPEEIMRLRASRKEQDLALFPHEREEEKCDYQHEAQDQAENEYENIDFDPQARKIMDDLHSTSVKMLKRASPFDESSQNKPLVSETVGFGAFQSCSVSSIAFEEVGNVALAAAAVVGHNNVYNVILFNSKSGEIISVLGSHFGYIYGLSFSPCGNYLASGAADGNIHIFKVHFYTFYGFHFWTDTRLEDISAQKAELQEVLNQKENQHEMYIKYKRFEATCDKNSDFKKGSIQLDIECLEAVTREIAACGPDLNGIVTNIEQVKVYDITKLIYLTTISVGLCVYEVAFLEVQDKESAKIVSPQLVIDQAKYVENPTFDLHNYKLLYAGYNGQLICHQMVNAETTSTSLSQFGSYINTFAVESVRVKSHGADKRIFYVFTCEQNGTAHVLKLDYQQNGLKKQEAFQCPEGIKSAAFLDDCKKVLLYLENGRLLLMDNSGKNKGTVVKDFQQEAHEQELPGGCKISKVGNTAYVGCYGGRILAISNTCNIVRAYEPFGTLIGGLVPSCVAGSKFGLLAVGFNILASSMITQYNPQLDLYYISVPIVILGSETRYEFVNGQLAQKSEENVEEEQQAADLNAEELDEENRAEEDMIQDYLDFIRNVSKDLK